ncbi:unnamed protein product [Onchocerca flexuosa]|nr:unnamed protein product [Onchocerca flexuosa]
MLQIVLVVAGYDGLFGEIMIDGIHRKARRGWICQERIENVVFWEESEEGNEVIFNTIEVIRRNLHSRKDRSIAILFTDEKGWTSLLGDKDNDSDQAYF